MIRNSGTLEDYSIKIPKRLLFGIFIDDVWETFCAYRITLIVRITCYLCLWWDSFICFRTIGTIFGGIKACIEFARDTYGLFDLCDITIFMGYKYCVKRDKAEALFYTVYRRSWLCLCLWSSSSSSRVKLILSLPMCVFQVCILISIRRWDVVFTSLISMSI